MNIGTALEVARFVFGAGLVAANVAVWYGVWLERDSAPKETQNKGWRILVRGLAAETALGFFLFAADTTLGVHQTAEIEGANGAARTAVKAADIANRAAANLQAALRIDAAAQKVLHDENNKLQDALSAANTQITGLKTRTLGIERKQADRHLTEPQKSALLLALTPFAGQTVDFISPTGVADAPGLMNEFATIFRSAGWKVDGPGLGVFNGDQPKGIQVTVNADDGHAGRFPTGAPQLVQTLVRLNSLMRSISIPPYRRDKSSFESERNNRVGVNLFSWAFYPARHGDGP